MKDASGGVLPGVTVEAASPVLIEKTRTVTSDGSGNYRIENLRPGTYTVTFTLTGFSTIKRGDIEVSGSFTTSTDATLRVGAVAETITVTGETPLVDISSTKKQVVIDHDSIQALPSSRQYFTLARVAPGTTGGGGDVGGGAIADVGQSLTVHGSKAVDQRVMLNGLSIMTLQAGGNIGGQQPDVGSAAEIAVDTTSLSAEMATGGIRINFIPKDGGNTFGNSTYFTFANQSMQGNNYTDALKAAGLATPTQIDSTWDLNESIGGPIKKDKAWFWFSTRYNRVSAFAGLFENANAYNPNAWTYVADTSKPSTNRGRVQQNNLRITWQATPKIKIAAEQKVDVFCNCPFAVGANAGSNGATTFTQRAPEAGVDRRFPRLRQEHVELSSPVTDRFLLEFVGMHLFERWGNMDLRATDNGGSLESVSGRGDSEHDLRRRAVQRHGVPELRGHRRRRPQQHHRAELHVPRGGVLRHGHAQLQDRLERHVRVPERVQLRLSADQLHVPQRLANQCHAVRRAVQRDQQRGSRLRGVRAGHGQV